MRINRANNAPERRTNALWGRGSKGESRSNALWGRGGRRIGALLATLVVAFAMAAGATAGGGGNLAAGTTGALKGYVAGSLLSAIQQNPRQSFDVIVQGDRNQKSAAFLQRILQNRSGASNENVTASNVTTQFTSITGGRMTLSGWQILFLAKTGLAKAILPNDTVQKSGSFQLPTYNTQLWPWTIGAPVNWVKGAPQPATIAIVDSGIDTTRADVAGRVIGQVNLASLTPNSPGDGYGHGTFVAGIAAGAALGHAGVAPRANLFSVDIMNDEGEGTVADVVAAADWILKNKSTYNIRVANFSLHAVNRASLLFDPIDQAVERLWLNGVVVVAAAGNYAVDGAESGVQFAPANDPFIITVGATDIGTSVKAADDTAAPWSAWGYSPDGFAKPDLGAPGRYMIGPVPVTAALTTLRAASVISPGYMQLSGTSFSAPAVAGAAAMLLGQHPDWTPDQVKGALMLTATPQPLVAPRQLGVGELDIAAARALKTTPPNPNEALNQFVVTNPDGTRVLDAAAWQSAAQSNAAWSSAAWSSAAWASAAWSSAAWASAAWASAAWSDAAWSSAAWSSVASSDNAAGDEAIGVDPTAAPDATEDSVLAELGIVDPNCDPTVQTCVAPLTSTVGGLLP